MQRTRDQNNKRRLLSNMLRFKIEKSPENDDDADDDADDDEEGITRTRTKNPFPSFDTPHRRRRKP